MRVLIINCVSDQCELALYRGLRERGVYVELFCDPRETRQDELRAFGIPTEELFIRNRFDLSSARAMRRRIREGGFDLVYAPTSRGVTTSLIATMTGPRPRLVTYRGTMGNLSYFNPLSRFAHLNARVDRIICNCQAVREFLLTIGTPGEKLAVIYKGHDPDWYAPRETATRREFGIPEEAPVAVCVANVRPLKGIDVLVEALSLLPSGERPYLLVAGEMRDDRLANLPRELGVEGHVRFLGFRSDVNALLAMADFTVMPSVRREGVPRAVVESLSVSVPAIVSNVGGLPEIVQNASSGLVVPPGDAKAIAEAIRTLVRNPSMRKSMGRRGREFVVEKLSVSRYVDTTFSLFESLVGKPEFSVDLRE